MRNILVCLVQAHRLIVFRPSHAKQGSRTLVRSGETQAQSFKECPCIRREDGEAIRRTLRVLTMISLRIASDAREVETVELSLLVRHHPNGRMAMAIRTDAPG